MKTIPATDVTTYIASFPEPTQSLLLQLRVAIIEAAPEAEETISYQMPAYKFHGPLVYFGGFGKHIGFYPGSNGVAAFPKELSGFKHSKGTIQFMLDQPIPTDLITKIVRFRMDENLQKAASKVKKLKRP